MNESTPSEDKLTVVRLKDKELLLKSVSEWNAI